MVMTEKTKKSMACEIISSAEFAKDCNKRPEGVDENGFFISGKYSLIPGDEGQKKYWMRKGWVTAGRWPKNDIECYLTRKGLDELGVKSISDVRSKYAKEIKGTVEWYSKRRESRKSK